MPPTVSTHGSSPFASLIRGPGSGRQTRGGEESDVWDVLVPLPCPAFTHLLQFKAGLVLILAGASTPRAGLEPAVLRASRAKRSRGQPPSHGFPPQGLITQKLLLTTF